MSVLAITYPLALPTVRAPKQTRFQLRYLVGIASSQFSAVAQVHDWGGRFWEFDAAYSLMSRAQADEFLVWGAKLNGIKGTFLAGDWDRRTPRGIISGSPLIDGGSQVGNLIAVKGLAPLATGVWLAGDMIQIENRLYRVVVQVDSDSSGLANVQIEPDLRSSPADEAPITYTNPKGLFRLKSDLSWDTDAAGAHSISFSAVEAL